MRAWMLKLTLFRLVKTSVDPRTVGTVAFSVSQRGAGTLSLSLSLSFARVCVSPAQSTLSSPSRCNIFVFLLPSIAPLCAASSLSYAAV
jgi:hypothetical protein